MFLFLYTRITGSPNCPTVNTAVTTSSLTVLIQNSQMTWLPEWYCVQVNSYNESIAITYNSTLKGTTSFEVTSLEPDTVYNISVIPCNMAGCNESCDVHSSVQTESEMSMEGETSKQNARLYAMLNQSVSQIHGGIESSIMEV